MAAENIPIVDEKTRRAILEAKAFGLREMVDGPDPSLPDKDGFWVPIAKPQKKNRRADGTQYLRWATRDAWAYCVEREGRILARMVIVRMDPGSEKLIGVPAGQITADDLRDVRLSIIDPYARKILPKIMPGRLSPASRRRLSQPPPRRYERKPKAWDAEVAELYLRALEKSDRQPIVWMTNWYKEHGYARVSKQQVRDWVRSCRTKGYLTMGRRGSPGASPGEELLKWRSRSQGLP